MKTASQILDDIYKKAQMEVPSDKEKSVSHVPEQYIDRAVADDEDLDETELENKKKREKVSAYEEDILEKIAAIDPQLLKKIKETIVVGAGAKTPEGLKLQAKLSPTKIRKAIFKR